PNWALHSRALRSTAASVFRGTAAIPLANVALGGCQQLIEFEPGLVTFVGRRAQDDKVVLAVLGDEDRLSRLAADSFDLRRLVAQVGDGADNGHETTVSGF